VFKNSLSMKIVIMVEVILLISSCLFCTVSISRARSSIRKSIQQRMLDIANCAAASVNGDVLKLLSADNTGGEESKEVYRALEVFRDNVELKYVYCIKKESEGHYIFTLDLDPLTPASYGDEVEFTEALDSAGNGKAAVDEVPYTDKWGEFYSAYSPVCDSDGNVAGIVAVDFAVDWFDEQLSAQTRQTISSYLIILVFCLLVGGILAMLTVRPYVRQQGELLEEKVRAESANHAKSDFLANMSHEIRTPINAVLGMNEMILREDRRVLNTDDKEIDSKTAKDALKNIGVYAADVENAGHNLLALVNDILDFSKIEAGRLDLVEAPYKLTSILNNISNMILFKAQDKGLNFIIDVDETLPNELLGDEMRVKQILTNILNNAVKYTEKGHVKLTLNGEKQGDDRILLAVSVEDTGIGIKEEDRVNLFKQFQRLEMEKNSTVEGTGLGLVITQRLLEMMGGSISVESEYGKGSIFSVYIPQKIVSADAVGNFEERFKSNVMEAKTYRESFRASSAHILIVDDTRINLTVATNLLKNTGIQIDTATGGLQSVNMALKNEYDLILMDQRMPEVDGTEALHRIRSSEGKSKDVPVICLTADAVVGAKERYLSEGFTDYLTKPIDSYELEKMLMKHLPKEKVELVRDEKDNGSSAPAGESDFSSLENAGIDTATGLKYCQKDESFYHTVLMEFVEVSKEKSADLNRAFGSKDWKNYEVHVHSLKSTAKMIGAKDLSSLAASLEAAAVSLDVGAIEANHDILMKKYKNVTEAINVLLPADKYSSDETDAAKKALEEDGILEFLPEEN